jgi:hypothetical protein
MRDWKAANTTPEKKKRWAEAEARRYQARKDDPEFREYVRTNQKRRYRENKHVRDASRAQQLRAKFGLTPEQVEAMAETQGQACASCARPFKTPKQRHVDHCHTTGKVRGLLCHGCNTGIGLFREDPDALRAAIQYLDRHRTSG